MSRKTRHLLLALALSSLFSADTSSGAWIIRLNSTYLGSGTFQYDLFMEHGPFLTQVDQLSLAGSFSNRSAYVLTPSGWTADTETNQLVSWENTNSIPDPVQETFSAQSLEPDFKTNSLYVLFIIDYPFCFGGGDPEVVSRNIAGYARLPALVPASAGEGGGAPSNLASEVTIISDARITEITDYTLTFEWDSESTLLIKASSNLQSWTEVEYLDGHPPSTT